MGSSSLVYRETFRVDPLWDIPPAVRLALPLPTNRKPAEASRAARPVGGAVVLRERQPMATSARGLGSATRASAFVALLVIGLYLGYGVSPLMASQCACSHGSEVPCDCPHHVQAQGSPPPPCHTHAKSHRGADSSSQQPCVRAPCGTIPPDLILIALVSTSERPALAPPPPLEQPLTFSPLRPPEIFIFPLKHPPKA